MQYTNCKLFCLTCFLLIISVSFTLLQLDVKDEPFIRSKEDSHFSSFRENKCVAPYVAITVSPLQSKNIHVSWYVHTQKENDWIGLFDYDPSKKKKHKPLFKEMVYDVAGWISSNITADYNSLRNAEFVPKCLSYWVAYVRYDGKVVASSCRKTNPTWMYDMRDHLRNLQVKKMFIPGTHDSGSYSGKRIGGFGFVEKYVFTQELDVLHQLIYGVRYLDLRISHDPNDLKEKWWINHGSYKIRSLKTVLQHVKEFLKNTREIVIIDFHGFPDGFKSENNKVHTELVNYIVEELSEWMAPADWSVTCGRLWNMNKTLLVSYNNLKVVKEFSKFLWTPIVHKWANAQSVSTLKDYINDIISSRPSYSWAAMAELTANLWSVISGRCKGIRKMAAAVNPLISEWFHGVWGRTCNIVAVDFVESTDIVLAAILWNSRRARKTFCDLEYDNHSINYHL